MAPVLQRLEIAVVNGLMRHLSTPLISLLLFFGLALIGDWEQATLGLERVCQSKVKGLKFDPDFISGFFDRIGSKDPFTTEEEKVFFANLLKLEDQIVKNAIELELIGNQVPEKRPHRISQIILPMLGQIKTLKQNPKAQSIVKDLERWDSMRTEVIQRNVRLLVHAVRRIRDISQWETQINEQLWKLNLAFQGFEPKYNFKFATYAMRAIFEGIARTSAKLNSPQHSNPASSRLVLKIRDLIASRYRKNLPEITPEEVAQMFGVSKYHARFLLNLSQIRMMELDAPIDSSSSETFADFVSAPDSPSEFQFEQEEARLRRLSELRKNITDPRVRLVLDLRHQQMSMPDIQKHPAVKVTTRQGVHAIYNEGAKALRAVIGIESGKIKQPEDRQLLIDYFGLYGTQKQPLGKLILAHAQGKKDILDRVEALLQSVEEEDLDLILEKTQRNNR